MKTSQWSIENRQKRKILLGFWSNVKKKKSVEKYFIWYLGFTLELHPAVLQCYSCLSFGMTVLELELKVPTNEAYTWYLSLFFAFNIVCLSPFALFDFYPLLIMGSIWLSKLWGQEKKSTFFNHIFQVYSL